MAKKVTTIPATKSRFTAKPLANPGKKKVAGYARVSTNNEEQETSYEAQVDYYTKYIKAHTDWEFAGMYADDGITGTSTKRRDGFNQMVEDALAGKIDLILTKSVSRFARNTVDSLTTVRQLKEKGIEIYFEKENIWTLDSKGELLITIMSSLAQEESRSISENVRWALRKRFADGKSSVAYGRFLGYDRGANGEWVVNEEQAETVRLIYKLFLSGLSCDGVARELERMKRKAPAGGDRWRPESVKSILKNEKYKGDALLQKEYTADFLTRKCVKNNGEVPQYYVEGHHEAIVTPEQYALVQNELKRRSELGKRYSGMSIFSSKLICGECGAFYGSKVWHSNDKYRRVIWRCNYKYGKSKCHTPHVTEQQVKEAFPEAYNKLIEKQENVIEDLLQLKAMRTDTKELEERLEKVSSEMEVIVTKTERLIAENASVAQNQTEYEKKYNELIREYETKEAEKNDIVSKIESAEAAGMAIDDFITVFTENKSPIDEFDSELWGCMVRDVVIKTDGSMVFNFKCGKKVIVD